MTPPNVAVLHKPERSPDRKVASGSFARFIVRVANNSAIAPMKWPAKRITASSPKSFGMYEKAAKLAAGGADLIHLEVGMPSFDTPPNIKDATIAALQRGDASIMAISAEISGCGAPS